MPNIFRFFPVAALAVNCTVTWLLWKLFRGRDHLQLGGSKIEPELFWRNSAPWKRWSSPGATPARKLVPATTGSGCYIQLRPSEAGRFFIMHCHRGRGFA